jgi:hypothetical protein
VAAGIALVLVVVALVLVRWMWRAIKSMFRRRNKTAER